MKYAYQEEVKKIYKRLSKEEQRGLYTEMQSGNE